MKKIIALLFCVLIVSCDDGNFDLPAFDFGETVYDCDVISNKYVVFRLASAEAIIVTLTTQQIKNEVTIDPIEVPISATNVIYRTFDAEISTSYFCEAIPPIEPGVLAHWNGVAGSSNSIFIETVEEFDANNLLIGYRHFITFQNLKLESGENFIIYEDEIFGDFVTSI